MIKIVATTLFPANHLMLTDCNAAVCAKIVRTNLFPDISSPGMHLCHHLQDMPEPRVRDCYLNTEGRISLEDWEAVTFFCQTPGFGQRLGVDFTFRKDNMDLS